MTTTYTSSLRLSKPGIGDTNWGGVVNSGATDLTDVAIAGYASVAMTDADYTLTTANGSTDQSRNMMLNMTGTLTAARNVICPTVSKLYFIKNSTSGGFSITIKTSAGSGINIQNGYTVCVFCDGTNVVEGPTGFTNIVYSSTLTGGTGVVNLGSGQFYKDASGNVGIGTSSPAAKLDVNGNINLPTTCRLGYAAQTDTATVAGVTAPNYGVGWGSYTGFAGLGVGVFGYYGLIFGTSGLERARIDSSGNLLITGAGGLGYGTGSGGTVTQATSRTTGVTLNKTNGSITLVSAAGTTSWLSFVVNNSTVAATDTVIVNQKSGADKYLISVTGVNAGSFAITFATTGGTTTEQPVFNFAVIKAVTS